MSARGLTAARLTVEPGAASYAEPGLMLAMPMPNTPEEVAVAGTILSAVAYLLIKHVFADFFLQTARQMREKGTYGALGGLTHCLTHVALTAPVFLFILTGITSTGMVALLALEFALHYHIDWLKEQFVRRGHRAPDEDSFWWALGVDQLMHGLTYVLLVWLAVAA